MDISENRIEPQIIIFLIELFMCGAHCAAAHF